MATETIPLAVDKAPAIQKGVCAEYPSGYNGPAVHWVGKLSQLLAGGGKVKLPKGFLPRRYFVKADKLPLDGRYGTETGLVSGDAVTLAVTSETLSGQTYVSGSGFTAFSGAVTASGGYGLVAEGVVASGVTVGTDKEYAGIAAASGAVLSGDAVVEVGLFLEQVDPTPEKMF